MNRRYDGGDFNSVSLQHTDVLSSTWSHTSGATLMACTIIPSCLIFFKRSYTEPEARLQVVAMYGDFTLASRLDRPPSAATLPDAQADAWKGAAQFNTNKPASAPNFDEEEGDDEPFRLILILQKPENLDATDG
jgi:hypothetical protein